MTLEYQQLLEDMEKELNESTASQRRKCVRSFKSNTRLFDDNSIEVTPQAEGTPSQRDVKKVGKSKRYSTTGKNPLTCIELKCPSDVADKAAFFHKELTKLTKDIQIVEPTLPKGEYLVNKDRLKVCFVKDEQKIVAWLNFDAKGFLEIRKQLYNFASEIDKCFVINSDSICPQP